MFVFPIFTDCNKLYLRLELEAEETILSYYAGKNSTLINTLTLIVKHYSREYS